MQQVARSPFGELLDLEVHLPRKPVFQGLN